jgi:hypothetical protein
MSLPRRCPRRPLRPIAAVAALAIAVGLGAAAVPAHASHGQITFMEAPRDLLNPKVRPSAIAKLQTLGVRALRIVMYWQDVAPAAKRPRPPAHFNPSSPLGYAWGQYDGEIAAAQQLHWPVLLTVSGPVPRWATASRRDNVTHPLPLQYQRFMTAIATHYRSAVSMYAVWNEPNHPFFLRPQFNANHTPASPTLYRALWEAAYRGLQTAGLKSPKLLMGETAPAGLDSGHGLMDLAPLAFLRGALCLNARYQKSSSCPKLPVYGWAHHAYSEPALRAGGPYWHFPEADNVNIGALSRLVRALDLAARAGAIRASMPIYLTEFGWQTKPNKFLAVPFSVQAQFDAISERIAYSNPRVVAFSQYLLRDDPLGGKPGSSLNGGRVGFQTGLESVNGRPKPLFYGFRLPLTVSRSGRGSFALWGLVRPATAATHVQVLVLDRGARRYRVLAQSVATDALGYWTLHSSDGRASSFEVRWRTPSGTLYTGAPITPYP